MPALFQHVTKAAMDRQKSIANTKHKLKKKIKKLCSCSTQLVTKFILLINVKVSIIVGILAFINMVNTSVRLKRKKLLVC